MLFQTPSNRFVVYTLPDYFSSTRLQHCSKPFSPQDLNSNTYLHTHKYTVVALPAAQQFFILNIKKVIYLEIYQAAIQTHKIVMLLIFGLLACIKHSSRKVS